jgi:hypothetical protein
MKKTVFALIFAVYLLQASASAEVNHGPVFRGFFAPYGAGSFTVPYDRSINGGTEGGLLQVPCGITIMHLKLLKDIPYPAGIFMTGSSVISVIQVLKQITSLLNTLNPGNEYSADASLWNADIRAGYRFSTPVICHINGCISGCGDRRLKFI